MAIALVAGAAVPASAASVQSGRFEHLRAQDLRVATVAYRLSIANAARCARDLAPQLGFVLHGIEQYGSTDREDAVRSFGLSSRVGVMAVVAGSPAEAAGLAAGDQLVAVNGRDLGIADAGAAPSRASVDRAQRMLAEEIWRGEVTLRVATPGGERDVRFGAALGCPSNVELVPGDAVNAWADGSRVMVSEGLLRLCATDDDLALVVGHEMAHNLLRHRERLPSGTSGLLASTGAGSAAMRESEEAADRLAVGFATTAAYDLSGAAPFLSALLDRAVRPAPTHPDRERRLAMLRAAIAEAQAGVPIVPLRG